MTLRAQHRLGVILGAFAPGVLGPFLAAQVNRACSGRPRRATPTPMEGRSRPPADGSGLCQHATNA